MYFLSQLISYRRIKINLFQCITLTLLVFPCCLIQRGIIHSQFDRQYRLSVLNWKLLIKLIIMT
jgi:hypothetical protein